MLVEVKQYQSNFDNWDFPGGPVVKNLPADGGNVGLILDPGRYHMLQSN